jgi:hypothetical protein
VKIQLLHFPECPNVEPARELLRAAMATAGVRVAVEEIDTMAEATPAELRGWGSPTILVDGVDVAGGMPGGDPTCRVYDHGGGRVAGVPSEVMVRDALARVRD